MTPVHTDQNDSKWYESLDEAKQDGYFPVKCMSLLEFYTLKGKSSKLIRDNIEPIRYLYYTVFDPNVNLYYVKFARAYPLDVLYFYRKTLTFSGEDEAVQSLRNYVSDGNVTLLFTKAQVDNTTDMLKRVRNANISGEGKLNYRIYIQILHESLQYEDYKDYGKSLTGFRTVCNQYEKRIDTLWKQVSEAK